MPERIQLRRTKGWRKPEDAVVVSRPSRWGNPYRTDDGDFAYHWFAEDLESRALGFACPIEIRNYPSEQEIRDELAGRDLACWCPLDQPCHADVLLEIANREVVDVG